MASSWDDKRYKMLNLPPNEEATLDFMMRNPYASWHETLNNTIANCGNHLQQGLTYYPVVVAWIANGKRELEWHEVEPFYNDFLTGKMALSL